MKKDMKIRSEGVMKRRDGEMARWFTQITQKETQITQIPQIKFLYGYNGCEQIERISTC